VAEISDAYMQEQLAGTREYAVVLLRAAAQYGREGSAAVIWEHGRRNFSLRADGLLSVVCPVTDDTELCVSRSSIPPRSRRASSWTRIQVSGPASSPTRSTRCVVSPATRSGSSRLGTSSCNALGPAAAGTLTRKLGRYRRANASCLRYSR
jgi:hypothetical protein